MALLNFEDRPYWRPDYVDGMKTLLDDIPVCLDKINKFVNKTVYSDFVDGFLIEYRKIYIIEICSGENKLQCKIESDKIIIDASQDNKRNRTKVRNLVKAIDHAFGENFSRNSYAHDLDAKFVKELNRLIGTDLFGNAGNYRKKPAKPSGYEYYYMEPEKIEEHMDLLFEETKEEINRANNLIDQIIAAAHFFSRFLGIHPFSNGNGRTARILFSALLIKYTFAPISLFSCYFSYKSNTEYLYCLEEAHAYTNSNLLHSLIVESIHRFCITFLTILDIEENDIL